MNADYVGIDVSKDGFDVAVCGRERVQRCDNTAPGIRKLIRHLDADGLTLIVIEATGGYERRLAGALKAALLPVAVLNPRQVRSFANAIGVTAKTDALDARVIARFAAAVQPEARTPADQRTRQLGDLLTRRGQLIATLVRERNRLGRAEKEIRRDINTTIAFLQKRIGRLDKLLEDRVEASKAFSKPAAPCCAHVPGVGPQLALSLNAFLPELGTLNRRQVAALVGVAPKNLRQRRLARQALHRRWKIPGQDCPVHGDAGGHPPQPCHPGVLRAPALGRQAQESCSRRLHAQTAADS